MTPACVEFVVARGNKRKAHKQDEHRRTFLMSGSSQTGFRSLSMSVARTPSQKSDGPQTIRVTIRKSIRRLVARGRSMASCNIRSVTFCESGEPLQLS